MTDNARAAGDRIEQILADLARGPDPRVSAAAEELVRTVVELYGNGLDRILEIAADGAPGLVDALATDPLVESLLLVHDLHPVDLDTRIQRALDKVRPYLGSHAGGVAYRGVDEDGVAQLTLQGTCNGCPSSTVTVQLSIERAIKDAAPELAGVQVEGQVAAPTGPKLIQIGRRPPAAAPSVPVLTAVDGWVNVAVPPGPAPIAVVAAGNPVLVCAVDQILYAYRDSCPGCSAVLSAGDLTDGVLGCPDCRLRFDIRLAGAGLTDPGRHLDPLPLLVDDGGVRIAVGAFT